MIDRLLCLLWLLWKEHHVGKVTWQECGKSRLLWGLYCNLMKTTHDSCRWKDVCLCLLGPLHHSKLTNVQRQFSQERMSKGSPWYIFYLYKLAGPFLFAQSCCMHVYVICLSIYLFSINLLIYLYIIYLPIIYLSTIYLSSTCHLTTYLPIYQLIDPFLLCVLMISEGW